MVSELIPFVDANYRTKATKAFRSIMGQSMGGFGCMFLGMRHPELFDAFAANSATPFWIFVTTVANPDIMFTSKGLVLPEVPTAGPDKCRVLPGPPDSRITNDFFSYSGAFSPNLAKPPYNVDLPFQTDANYKLPEFLGTCTMLADLTAIAQWDAKDPYFLLDNPVIQATMKRQGIYFDGGDREFANAVGAHFFANKLIDLAIEHEYVLYQGFHTTCLEAEECSRFETDLKLFSARYAAAGQYVDDVRVKLMGTGTITLAGNATLTINSGTFIGIETSSTGIVTNTDYTIEILDNARLLIGDDTVAGGALQIGNRFNKAILLNNPSLNTHTVQAKFIINGPGALFRVGKQGFLGFGVGIDGKAPEQPNFWGISSLTNVTNIACNFMQGSFVHKQIATGDSNQAALWAIGTSDSYTFNFDTDRMAILGGGNLGEVIETWALHVQVRDVSGVVPHNDIHSRLNTGPSVDDFYNQSQQSFTFYLDNLDVNIFSSGPLLRDRKKPASLTNVTQQELYDYLKVDDYLTQGAKRADISRVDQNIVLGFITQEEVPEEDPIFPINRVPLPNQSACIQKNLDIEKILATGAIGIKLVTIDNEPVILRVYDLDPA